MHRTSGRLNFDKVMLAPKASAASSPQAPTPVPVNAPVTNEQEQQQPKPRSVTNSGENIKNNTLVDAAAESKAGNK